jgi:hypothetical protein
VAIGLHVADLCLNRAAMAQVYDQFWRQATPCAADHDAGGLNTVVAVSAVDDGQIGALIRQYLHLLEGLFQGVAVVRVSGKAAHAGHEAFVQRGGYAVQTISGSNHIDNDPRCFKLSL